MSRTRARRHRRWKRRAGAFAASLALLAGGVGLAWWAATMLAGPAGEPEIAAGATSEGTDAPARAPGPDPVADAGTTGPQAASAGTAGIDAAPVRADAPGARRATAPILRGPVGQPAGPDGADPSGGSGSEMTAGTSGGSSPGVGPVTAALDGMQASGPASGAAGTGLSGMDGGGGAIGGPVAAASLPSGPGVPAVPAGTGSTDATRASGTPTEASSGVAAGSGLPIGGLPGLAGFGGVGGTGGFGAGGTLFGDVLGANAGAGTGAPAVGPSGCPPSGCPVVATAMSSQALARASDVVPASNPFADILPIVPPAPAGAGPGEADGTAGTAKGTDAGSAVDLGTHATVEPPTKLLPMLSDEPPPYPPCEPETPPPTHPVPLPASWLLLLAGAAAIAGSRRRRRDD